jgi:two-component system OmpR family response regulator
MGTVKVLVADDNKDAADTVAALLEAYGSQVCTCYDGQSALIEAGRFRPDVCLLDLNMPGMDGDQLAVRIRESFPDLPARLVAITALGSEEARKRTSRAGFDLHLVKPVDPSQLLAIISHLGKPSQSCRCSART